MEKGVFFSPKYYGNYGKIILKMSGHPVYRVCQKKGTLLKLASAKKFKSYSFEISIT